MLSLIIFLLVVKFMTWKLRNHQLQVFMSCLLSVVR